MMKNILEINVQRLHRKGCPLESLYEITSDMEVNKETLLELESTLTKLQNHETYIRELRQEIHRKIRIFKLSENARKFLEEQ